MINSERLQRHLSASGALTLLADSEVESLIAAGERLGSGIGGETFRIDITGVPIFVKRIPLTGLELDSAAGRPTTNLFGLPSFCHYGIGSPGFGAWREVAAHEMTTDWVLTAQTEAFPLTYHWRIMPGKQREVHDELDDVEAVVSFWNGSPAVRARVEALASAPAAVWIFLEFLPFTLNQWLSRSRDQHSDLDSALGMVEDGFSATIDFMAEKGFIHFDAHFDNILTDGRQLYFADLGLALSSDFELRGPERDFFRTHLDFDRSYVFTYLVRWLLSGLGGIDRAGHQHAIDAYINGGSVVELPPSAARIVQSYAGVAASMMPFYRDLQAVSRTTPYPRLSEQRAWATRTGR